MSASVRRLAKPDTKLIIKVTEVIQVNQQLEEDIFPL